MVYSCKDCNAHFKEPLEHARDEWEGSFDYCPDCVSSNIGEVVPQTCAKCNQPLSLAYDFARQTFMALCLNPDHEYYVYMDKDVLPGYGGSSRDSTPHRLTLEEKIARLSNRLELLSSEYEHDEKKRSGVIAEMRQLSVQLHRQRQEKGG